jgi:hypothetical protein
MYEILKTLADAQGGVVMRSQAVEAGYHPDDIDRLLKRGEWVSLRRGAYVEREVLDAMDDVQKHRARVHAVIRSLRVPAVVSHASAAVMHGLPEWGLDLDNVHVSRTDLHSPRTEAGVHHHAGEIKDTDVVEIDGLRVMSLPRAIIDTARITDFEAAVCVADAAIALDPTVQSAALDRLNEMRDWQGSRNAGAVIEFADGRSESVGESRLRVLFRNHLMPKPELQVEFRRPSGLFVARSDFYFRKQRTIGEFDGKKKYLKFVPEGEDPGEVVWREKRREDELRRLGNEVVRVIWVDFDREEDVVKRFKRAFELSAQRPRRAA